MWTQAVAQPYPGHPGPGPGPGPLGPPGGGHPSPAGAGPGALPPTATQSTTSHLLLSGVQVMGG